MSVSFDPVHASALGVKIRRERAKLKEDLRSGARHLIQAFDQAADEGADPVLAGLRVEWFLRAIPGFGATKTARLLDSLGIRPSATLGGLRVRQRSALRAHVVTLFRKYYPELRGIAIILVGPSGVGKGTIVEWITSRFPDFVLSVSATTRARRAGEREGEHYFFVTPEKFDSLIREGELVEWAVVHGEHRYGTPGAPLEHQLDEGKNVILEIDVQGAKRVKRKLSRSVGIFVAPPSFEELEARLRRRGTEDSREIETRLATARSELAVTSEFDYVVINNSVEDAGKTIVDLALASKDLRLPRRKNVPAP